MPNKDFKQPLGITQTERIARVRADLRIGLPVVLRTKTQASFIAAIERLDQSGWARMRSFGQELSVVLTRRRAETLKAHVYYDDIARIAVEKAATLEWLYALADPSVDLTYPLKGPFTSLRQGDSALYHSAVALCKKAHLLPAALVVECPSPDEHSLSLMGFSQLSLADHTDLLHSPIALQRISSARFPLAVSKDSKLHVFRSKDGGEEHYAIEIGKPKKSSALVRLHSACFTGDLLGSRKCDCGAQLTKAMETMGKEKSGVLLYLNQEGRGIGLANKMRAYDLQNQGFDTVEANHRLGFEDDERDFRIGAEILTTLGYNAIRLMTNNPAKVAMMKTQGIEVCEQVPLAVGRTPENTDYLKTKKLKSGHLL